LLYQLSYEDNGDKSTFFWIR